MANCDRITFALSNTQVSRPNRKRFSIGEPLFVKFSRVDIIELAYIFPSCFRLQLVLWWST